MGLQEKALKRMMGSSGSKLVQVIESLHAYQEEQLKALKKILRRLDAMTKDQKLKVEDPEDEVFQEMA